MCFDPSQRRIPLDAADPLDSFGDRTDLQEPRYRDIAQPQARAPDPSLAPGYSHHASQRATVGPPPSGYSDGARPLLWPLDLRRRAAAAVAVGARVSACVGHHGDEARAHLVLDVLHGLLELREDRVRSVRVQRRARIEQAHLRVRTP